MGARIFAIPNEHGAWALWIGPFLVGWGVAWQTTPAVLAVFLAVGFVFMARHPMMIMVRALSGRRKREDARPAAQWTALYLVLAGLAGGLLVWLRYGPLLLLALPAVPLLIWQMVLVKRKAERQVGIELVGSGVLALAAPAAYTAATGQWTRLALMLWLLTWLYSAVSIVYVYLRLQQRKLVEAPETAERLELGRMALRFAAVALVLVTATTLAKLLPRFAPLPFVLLQLQVILGTINPAIGYKPNRLGFAQVGAMAVFVAVTILVFRI
jgi:hypothetical protein